MNLKKLFGSTLALTLSALMLSACSDSADSSSGASSAQQDSEQSAAHTARNDPMEDMSSQELVSKMTLGWNLGNSLDVCNADRDGDGLVNESAEVVDETLWGNVKTTKELFERLKADGFNSVRIPVTWRDHLDDSYTIDSAWLDRVQEVVDYAYDLDMYVIINLHHDGGGDPDFGAWIRNASDDYDGVLEKYKKLWQQICSRFEGYDERLIFESMNEVGFDDLSASKAFETLNDLNQEFVDLVRASGGNNPQRHLLIAGYWTDIEQTCRSYYKMPNDPAGKCILSVHYYTPWEFCTTTINYTWGTDSEVSRMEHLIGKLKTNFVDKGVPVIIGEFGTGMWNETESGLFFTEKLVSLCHEYGIAAYMWDDGSQLDRTSFEWSCPEFVETVNRALTESPEDVNKAA